MIRAGELNRRITLQGPVQVQSDSGEITTTWSTIATVWAKKVEARGAERFAARQLVGKSVTTFLFRWSSTVDVVTTKHRVLFDGRDYDIIDRREFGFREGIEVDCTSASEEPLTP